MATSSSIGVLFEEHALRGASVGFHLDRPLDIDAADRRRLLLGDMASLVSEASGWLAALGVGPWDRVAVVKRNHFDSILLACAAARSARSRR